MTTIRRYLSLREVAAAMGVTARWLYGNRARLTRECGFPRAALGLRYRWDEADIVAWQDRMRTNSCPVAQHVDVRLQLPDNIDWAAELDRRASTL